MGRGTWPCYWVEVGSSSVQGKTRRLRDISTWFLRHLLLQKPHFFVAKTAFVAKTDTFLSHPYDGFWNIRSDVCATRHPAPMSQKPTTY